MTSFIAKQKTVLNRRRKLLSKLTEYELRFAQRLRGVGILFIEQKGFIQGDGYCICDFYLPRPRRIVIEIDGEYHAEPDRRRKDYAKDRYLQSRGFKVIRIPNHEVDTFDMELLK